MSDRSSESGAQYLLLTRLADEFAARYRAGERPSLEHYIDRHPELADDIRELLPAMAEIEQVKEDQQGATQPVAAPDSLALKQVGDFRIIRQVGKGGMGVVFEAEQVARLRHVALKVLPRSMIVDAQATRRFEREAKSAARLHHTNIVPVFGVGEHDGMPYYVMQFIQGLREKWCRKSGVDLRGEKMTPLFPTPLFPEFPVERTRTLRHGPATTTGLTGSVPPAWFSGSLQRLCAR